MKRLSIHELKAQLSGAISDAASGQTIVITRHNEPVAQLGPAQARGVRRGNAVGSGRLTPLIPRGTRGRYLEVLGEDRGGR